METPFHVLSFNTHRLTLVVVINCLPVRLLHFFHLCPAVVPSIPFFKRIFQSIYRQTQRQARLPSPRRLASFRRNFSLSWSLVGPQLLRLLTAAWPAPFFHTSTSTVQRGGRSARTQQLDANPLLFLYSLRRPQWASSPDCPRQPTSAVQQQPMSWPDIAPFWN